MSYFRASYHMLRSKSTQFLSYKHQNHQKIIQYSDNLTIIHTIPRYFWCKTKERCKITSNPPNRPIWFVDAQLWFADAAFCISNTQHLLKITSISTLFFQNPCTIQINVLPLHQQNPPRLPLDQRTRAGLLLLYLCHVYTQNYRYLSQIR